MTWSELDRVVRSNGSFLISTHLNPDGDCIGSQLAFAWYLELLGKCAVIYNKDPVPSKFAFLAGADRIVTGRPNGPFDVLAVLDASNLGRLGWEDPQSAARLTINIDHHRDNARFGALNIVEPLSATAQILFHLFEEGGVRYPPTVAEALYTALLTDTGGFRFSNTTADVLRVCATLAERGANPATIYERVYASGTVSGMKLHARVWPTLAFHLGERVCSMELPMKLVAELGATYGDTEGMADLTLMAEHVLVGVFIKHTENQTHFSLRSKNHIDVGKMARRVPGGGGHVNAAGCTIDEPIVTAFPKMLAIIGQELG